MILNNYEPSKDELILSNMEAVIMLKRPRTNEYHPFFERYITLVPEEGLLDILKKQQETTINLLKVNLVNKQITNTKQKSGI
jgi:hypothetical protein